MRERLLPWLTLFARLLLGGVLFAAGLLKAKNTTEAGMAVRAYRLLPSGLANTFGYILPWFEMGIATLLILGIAVRISALLGGALMLLFIVAVSQAWARGLSIDCGCFGGGGNVAPGHTKYLQEILRDIGLVIIAFYLTKKPHGRFGLDKSDV
jgi:uncharacterized membrane protein YphA (DoxX/SURF4 family)